MSKPKEEGDHTLPLRQRAEDALAGKPVDLDGLLTEDIQYILHELQVHQIELTLQNEELRQTQLALDTARDQYSSLYNFAPAGYCTLDRKGYILKANQTLADMLGVSPKQLIHKKLSAYISREDQDRYYLNHLQIFDDHRRHVIDIEMASRMGTRIAIRLESSMDPEDHSRILAILSDITEQKRAERALTKYTQDLERANQALSDFSFIASHDLQEPLRKVKSFGEMLKSRYGKILEAEGNDYISRMISAAERMSSLLEGLLAYSRVAMQNDEFVDVDLNQVTSEVLADLEGRLMQTNGKVVLGELPHLQADPLQMRQLFQNLISNALKYHRPGVPPLVTLSSHPAEDGWVELSVEDNGIGIDMAKKDYIFDPFTRVSGKPDYEGAGIGLTICKKIIERHKGSIAVSSVLGQGSIFTVTLPILQATSHLK